MQLCDVRAQGYCPVYPKIHEEVCFLIAYLGEIADELVDIGDIFQVLGAWGPCNDCPEDLNDDGNVNIDDIFAVLANWGPCP